MFGCVHTIVGKVDRKSRSRVDRLILVDRIRSGQVLALAMVAAWAFPGRVAFLSRAFMAWLGSPFARVACLDLSICLSAN